MCIAGNHHMCTHLVSLRRQNYSPTEEKPWHVWDTSLPKINPAPTLDHILSTLNLPCQSQTMLQPLKPFYLFCIEGPPKAHVYSITLPDPLIRSLAPSHCCYCAIPGAAKAKPLTKGARFGAEVPFGVCWPRRGDWRLQCYGPIFRYGDNYNST